MKPKAFLYTEGSIAPDFSPPRYWVLGEEILERPASRYNDNLWNCANAFYSRSGVLPDHQNYQGFEKACTDYWDEAWPDFVKEIGLFKKKIYVSETDCLNWFSRFGTARKAEYLESLERFQRCGFPKGPMFVGFVKDEGGKANARPRLIQGLNDSFKFVGGLLGPFLDKLADRMKSTLVGPLVYTGGRSAEQLAELVDVAIRRAKEAEPFSEESLEEPLETSEILAFYRKKYDYLLSLSRRQRKQLLDYELACLRVEYALEVAAKFETYDFLPSVGFEETDVEKMETSTWKRAWQLWARSLKDIGVHPAAYKFLWKKSVPAGVFLSDKRVKYCCGWGTPSGTPDTGLGNTALNLCNWLRALKELAAAKGVHYTQLGITVFVYSDDAFLVGPRALLKELNYPLVSGMKVKRGGVRSPAEITFLGGCFLPSSSGFLLCPLPGRLLFKLSAIALRGRSLTQGRELYASIIRGLSPSVSHHPLLGPLFERLLPRLPAVPPSVEPHKVLVSRPHRIHPIAEAFVCLRYGCFSDGLATNIGLIRAVDIDVDYGDSLGGNWYNLLVSQAQGRSWFPSAPESSLGHKPLSFWGGLFSRFSLF